MDNTIVVILPFLSKFIVTLTQNCLQTSAWMTDVVLLIQDQTERKEFAFVMVLNRAVLPMVIAVILTEVVLINYTTGSFPQVGVCVRHCVCLCLFVGGGVCLFVGLFGCLFVCLFVGVFVCLFVCLFLLFVC